MPTKPTGRPRGRPKGSKNVMSLLQFTEESLSYDPPVPPAPKRTKRGGGAWEGMNAEERKAYSARIRAKRNPENAAGGRPKGVRNGLTLKRYNEAIAAQQPLISRILKKMSDKGQLPDDPMAVEALREAMTVLRAPQTAKDKIAAARLILDFTKSKPTAKVEHTVRSAEDILDEMADEE